MENARLAQQDDEILERIAKRQCTPRARLVGEQKARQNTTPQLYNARDYESTTANDDSTVVVGDNHGTIVTHHHHHHARQTEADKDLFGVLCRSLAFDRIHARLDNVARALPSTCHWLFLHKHFITWKANGGFLWIKGKPGSGKSTLMKEAHSWAADVGTIHPVLSYFFNARSPNAIERSPLGLYRSLLHQLLSAFPQGHDLFASRFRYKIKIVEVAEAGGTERKAVERKVVEEWTEVELQNFLREVVRTKKLPVMSIFVDALDEGQEDEVRSMIRFLESFARETAVAGARMHICLSSRHYPNMTVRTSLKVVVEDETGQRSDIETYISSELLMDGSDAQAVTLRTAILDRANGIFLWAVLVIRMLNTLYDQGEGIQAMRQRLSCIPGDLHKLFADILSRDAKDMNKSITLFRWVLFSETPMPPDDLYLIIQRVHHQGGESKTLPDPLTISKYLLNCSRGLTESTKTSPPVVQFIHETVRNYLLDSALATRPSLGPNTSTNFAEALLPAVSHMVIAEDCLEYFIQKHYRSGSLESESEGRSLYSYTSRFWSCHFSKSTLVESRKLKRLALLLFKDPRMLSWYVRANADMLGVGTNQVTPLICAAALGMTTLVSLLVPPAKDVNVMDDARDRALFVAAGKGHEAVVRILLEAGARAYGNGGLIVIMSLEAAATNGHEQTVRLLLDCVAEVGSQSKYGHALVDASYAGHAGVVRVLLEQGADPDFKFTGCTALQVASSCGHTEVVQILLDGRALPNLQLTCRSPLLAALQEGHGGVVSLLLGSGASFFPQEDKKYSMKSLLENLRTR